jgi:hypothetical protein
MSFVLATALAVLVALPEGASAQAGEEGTTAEPKLRESAPLPEPASEEPVLRLELDDDSVRLAPGAAWREEHMGGLEQKARKTRNALIGTSAATVVGGSLIGIAQTQRYDSGPGYRTKAGKGLLVSGVALFSGGLIGALVTGIMLGVQKGKLRELQRAHYGEPLRVQWDLARSQLVF